MLFDKKVRGKGVKSACNGKKKSVKSSVKKFKVNASTGDIKYTKKPVTASQKYTLVDYFDVWGNPEDGFEVNDATTVKNGIEIPDDMSDNDIVQMLIDMGYLNNDAKSQVEVEMYGENIEFVAKETGEPICALQPEYGVTSSTKHRAKKSITAADSYGWVVESWEAHEAYDMAAEAWGAEDINQQIVDCISDDELAACLAFIFRMNDFREWDERNDGEDDEKEWDEYDFVLNDAEVGFDGFDEEVEYYREHKDDLSEDDLYQIYEDATLLKKEDIANEVDDFINEKFYSEDEEE